jgi:hypothetical protein
MGATLYNPGRHIPRLFFVELLRATLPAFGKGALGADGVCEAIKLPGCGYGHAVWGLWPSTPSFNTQPACLRSSNLCYTPGARLWGRDLSALLRRAFGFASLSRPGTIHPRVFFAWRCPVSTDRISEYKMTVLEQDAYLRVVGRSHDLLTVAESRRLANAGILLM